MNISLLTISWVKKLVKIFAQDINNFKLLLPAQLPESNASFCELQNSLPSADPIWDVKDGKSPTFFDSYLSLIEIFSGKENILQKEIGDNAYKNWKNYLEKQRPAPATNSIPTAFRKWAMHHVPHKANIGSSILAREILIDGFEKSREPYKGKKGQSIDFKIDLNSAKEKLAVSPSSSAAFKIMPNCGNVPDPQGHTMVKGIFSHAIGLDSIDEKFALNEVQVVLKVDKWADINVVPGEWYNSMMVQLALSSKDASWWPKYFGKDGALSLLLQSLIIASGLELVVTSKAAYSREDQATIRANISAGCWPMYCSDQKNAWSNKVEFTENGEMILRCESHGDQLLVFGANAMPVGSH